MPGDSEKPGYLIKFNGEQDSPFDAMPDDVWSIYDQLSECDRFDADLKYGDLCRGPNLIYAANLKTDDDPLRLYEYSRLAIKVYCKENDGKKLKLKKPVKWNLFAQSTRIYVYITFTAEDEETREVETYQAKLAAMNALSENNYVEMVRVKPKEGLPGFSSGIQTDLSLQAHEKPSSRSRRRRRRRRRRSVPDNKMEGSIPTRRIGVAVLTMASLICAGAVWYFNS